MSFVRISGYPMDLAVNEGHSFPGEVTKYPVEVGADVSDHIRDLPPEITLECIVSDLVPGELATDPQRGQTVVGPDGTVTPVLASQEALAKLRELKALRRPVTIETSIGTFDSMAFVTLDVPADKDKGPGKLDQKDPSKNRRGALFFTAKFSKFNQVTNARTRVRTRTAMPTGGKAKAVVPIQFKLVRSIKWFVGLPPGAPWRKGGPIIAVNVLYKRPAGVPNNQVVVHVDEILRYEELGYQNGILEFVCQSNEEFFDVGRADGLTVRDPELGTGFVAGLGVPLRGRLLNHLRLDLLRDRRDQDSARLKGTNVPTGTGTDFRTTPDGGIVPRQLRNVPLGIDTSRLQMPTGIGTDSVKTSDGGVIPANLPSTAPGT